MAGTGGDGGAGRGEGARGQPGRGHRWDWEGASVSPCPGTGSFWREATNENQKQTRLRTLRVWWFFFVPSPPPRGPAAPVPPPSDVAEVEVGLLYPPVGGDLLRLVALHVLLHGGEAGAVLQADGALVGGSAVVGPKVFDHGRVVPGALVAQFALEGLLACGRQGRQRGRGAVINCPSSMWAQPITSNEQQHRSHY